MRTKKKIRLFEPPGFFDFGGAKKRFAFKGDEKAFVRILADMRQNGGPLVPIPHWDVGYSRGQNDEALHNEEAYKIKCEKMESMLDPWVGCQGMQPIGEDEWTRYKLFFEKQEKLGLLPKNANANKLKRRGWINTDLGSVMDVNFIHSFSDRLHTGDGKLYALEVGGGYGRLAEALSNVFDGRIKHVMLDAVPASLMYAYMYLSRRCKDRKIGFYYNDDPFDMDKFDIYVMPSWHFERLNKLQYDVAINIESMQEMGQEHVDFYLTLFDKNVRDEGLVYLSNAHDYVFKGVWNYPPNWRRLYLSNTPRSWSPDHPTEIFQKTANVKSGSLEANEALEKVYAQSIGKGIDGKISGIVSGDAPSNDSLVKPLSQPIQGGRHNK